MSYILGQIVICLLLAGLLGAVLGWLLRGGCSDKLRDCEDEWKMKMGSLESNLEFNEKQTIVDASKNHAIDNETTQMHNTFHQEEIKPSHGDTAHAYEQELKEKLLLSKQNEVDTATKATLAGTAAVGAATLASKGFSLSADKADLYKQHGIDLENASHLEDDYELHALDDIDTAHSEKLKNLGIRSTKDFANLSSDANASLKVAKELNVETSTVDSWIGKSCLLELPGVDNKTANMLHKAGITSNRIIHESPEVIEHELTTYNKKSTSPLNQTPDAKSISLWSRVAKPIATSGMVGTAALGALSTGGKLSDKTVSLYKEAGVDFNMPDIEDNYDIEKIEGVNSTYAKALKAAGIHDTKELVNALYSNHDRLNQLANSLEIEPNILSSWVSRADLMRLPGVDAKTASLMQSVGISSNAELAITGADNLHQALVEFNDKAQLKLDVPTSGTISTWSKVAKLLS